MAKQKHTARKHPVVPNKKTVAATKEARQCNLVRPTQRAVIQGNGGQPCSAPFPQFVYS